jgi:hypothetical protein
LYTAPQTSHENFFSAAPSLGGSCTYPGAINNIITDPALCSGSFIKEYLNYRQNVAKL